MNELVTTINTGNANLDKELKEIEKTISKEASARLEQAYRIGRIQENAWHKEAGYETISECFADTFGADISEKTISALARIGRTVLTMKNNKVVSIIAHEVVDESTGKNKIVDYSYTVLNQILSIGADKLIECDADGRIWPEMTLKQAKEFMKTYKQIGQNDAESNDGEAEGETENDQMNEADYKKLLDRAYKALEKLFADFDLSKEDSKNLIDLISENTYNGGE